MQPAASRRAKAPKRLCDLGAKYENPAWGSYNLGQRPLGSNWKCLRQRDFHGRWYAFHASMGRRL